MVSHKSKATSLQKLVAFLPSTSIDRKGQEWYLGIG